MTILATPAAYSSLQDDLIFTVWDVHATDSSTYPNYKYVADVYIGATQVARIKKVQDPATGIGIFNIGQIVRNYLATSFNPTANLLVAQQLGDAVFNLTVTLKFGEEYAYTVYSNLVTDSARIFFNNYNSRRVGVTSSLIAKANKLASDSPLIGQVLQSAAYYFVPYFATTTTPVAVVFTPIGGGSAFSTTIIPAVAYNNLILNISPQALNAAHAGAVNNSTTSYTVQVGSQTYTINVICEAVYSVYTIHFLNKYGGFESKIFSKVSRKTLDITRKDFGKLPYTVDSSGIVSYKNANGVYNESRSVYSSQFVEKLVLNSDLLTDAEYTWLADLILSPLVYIEDSGYFFPCLITDNNYEPKKNINDDLTNLTINIEYGITQNAQFR